MKLQLPINGSDSKYVALWELLKVCKELFIAALRRSIERRVDTKERWELEASIYRYGASGYRRSGPSRAPEGLPSPYIVRQLCLYIHTYSCNWLHRDCFDAE